MGGLYVVILAAGKSKRINSRKSKLLLPLCGKPLLAYPTEAALSLSPDKVILVVGGPHKDCIIKNFSQYNVEFVEQPEPLGTGDAVRKTEKVIPHNASLVVMPGDAPLIKKETLKKLVDFHREKNAVATVLTVEHPNPAGYGRIVRSKGDRILMIVEEKDAFPEEKAIKEINSGIYVFESGKLFEALRDIRPDNRQKEYYLTDVIEILQRREKRVYAFKIDNYKEITGVNTREQFSEAAIYMQEEIKRYWLNQGVTFIDPRLVYIESDVEIGKDAVIYPFVSLLGKTKIGSEAVVGPNRILKDVEVKDGEELF